jgi:hypothetical protein
VIGIESIDFENFAYAALASLIAADLDNDGYQLADFGLNRAIRHFGFRLQGQRGKTGESFAWAFSVNRAQRSRMSGIQRLHEIPCFCAAYFANEDTVGPVAESDSDEIPNRDFLDILLFTPGLKSEHVWASEH